LIAEPVVKEHPIQQLTTSIPGKCPTRSIGTLCTWRKSNDQDLSLGITEPRNRLSPIVLISKSPDLSLSDSFPMRDKTRTDPTGDDSVTKLGRRHETHLNMVRLIDSSRILNLEKRAKRSVQNYEVLYGNSMSSSIE
jgi:hypothetical protein